MKSNRQAGAATLEDVAQAAGVSLATASRIMNETTRNVNPEYRERVLAAARELSYSPNLAARAVAQGGGTSTVALIVPDIADPYFSTIASGVARGRRTWTDCRASYYRPASRARGRAGAGAARAAATQRCRGWQPVDGRAVALGTAR
jgi:hypothetical protein